MFASWDEVDVKPRKHLWATESIHLLSVMCSLQELRSGVVGWGCCRLVNASKAKPAETAVFALPPATAVLRRRPEGDMQLTVSFHLAAMHQVPRS